MWAYQFGNSYQNSLEKISLFYLKFNLAYELLNEKQIYRQIVDDKKKLLSKSNDEKVQSLLKIIIHLWKTLFEKSVN